MEVQEGREGGEIEDQEERRSRRETWMMLGSPLRMPSEIIASAIATGRVRAQQHVSPGVIDFQYLKFVSWNFFFCLVFACFD